METRPDPIIANAWHELAQLVGDLRAALIRAGIHLSAKLRRQIARDVRLAEAMARRAIVLMAAALDLPPLSADRISPSRPRQSRENSATQRGFALFEALWRMPKPSASDPTGIPTNLRPTAINAAGLTARLEILHRVLANPDQHARRLARLQQRRCDGRVSPMRPGWPPGSAGRRPDDWLVLTLGDLDVRARRVVYRAWHAAPG